MDILIVDDSVTTRKVVRRSLVTAGVRDDQIGEAGDGSAALEILEAQLAPALVLCDVNMPIMSGEELLEKAAALEPKHSFVMVTSVASTCKKLELMQLGAKKIVAKPFDPKDLADLIAPYLRPDECARVGKATQDATPTPLPDDAELATLGMAALQSVLETMAFSLMIPTNEDPPRAILFGASMRLDAGEKQWIVRLAADARAAGELSLRLTSQPPGEDEGLRLDAMRELVNMVGGDLVNRTVARFEGATLSLPTSSVLPPGRRQAWNGAGPAARAGRASRLARRRTAGLITSVS